MEPVFLDLTALKLRGRRVKLYYQKNIWAFSYLPIVQSIQKANNNKHFNQSIDIMLGLPRPIDELKRCSRWTVVMNGIN